MQPGSTLDILLPIAELTGLTSLGVDLQWDDMSDEALLLCLQALPGLRDLFVYRTLDMACTLALTSLTALTSLATKRLTIPLDQRLRLPALQIWDVDYCTYAGPPMPMAMVAALDCPLLIELHFEQPLWIGRLDDAALSGLSALCAPGGLLRARSERLIIKYRGHALPFRGEEFVDLCAMKALLAVLDQLTCPVSLDTNTGMPEDEEDW